MTIEEALQFFQKIKSESVDDVESKSYEKFICILKDLQKRDLTHEQLAAIHTALSMMNLKAKTDNKKKYYKQRLSSFQKFLKEQFSLVVKGYYIGVGIGLGIIFGSIFSLVFQSVLGTFALLLGVIGGMFWGGCFGAIMDAKAKKQGRVLATE